MKPKIGLIGAGQTVGIAHYHAAGVQADGQAEIAAVYDLDQAAAARFVQAHDLEGAVLCESYAQLLDAVDAVLVCTPNATHVEYVLGAIQAGKPFLVEKPLALTAAESRAAVLALQARPVWNMVGFVYRYALAMQALRKLVRDEIGPVYSFSATFGGRRLANPANPLEWRMVRRLSGSGALGDFGSHLVDAAWFTAGLKFETVSGLVSTVIPTRPADAHGRTKVENDDLAVFVAKTAAGALASFTVSRVGLDDLALAVAGQGGLARLSLSRPDCLHFWPAPGGVYAPAPAEIPIPSQVPFQDWFIAQMKAFVDGLYGIESEVAGLSHGHYVECVLEAAEQSSLAPHTPVEVAA